LNVCPKTFSIGQASWQAEHGNPYLRANAGKARLGVGLLKKIERQNNKARALAKPANTGWEEERFALATVGTPICIAITSQSEDG
jgi:hypothetical protein